MACNDKNVTTSLTVSFSVKSSDSANIVAEVDDRDDGLNAGNTDFSPGDRVGFLVWPGEGVSIANVTSSLGSVSGAGSAVTEEKETVTFTIPDSIEHTLNKNPSGFVTMTWIGTPAPGNLQRTGQKIKLALTPGICYPPTGHILKVEYTSNATGYYLNHTPPLGEDEYEILVLIVGTTA